MASSRALGVDVAGHRREEAHEIRRTALERRPLPARVASVAGARETVDVEKAVAGTPIRRTARCCTCRAPSRRCTCCRRSPGNSRWLSVMNISTAHVSEYAEMFGSTYGSPNPSLPVAADAAGDVHLLRRPHRSTSAARRRGRPQPGEHADVRQRHHERDAVHGVAHGFALLEHGLVRLVVAAAIHRVLEAADIEVVLGQVEMLLVVRRPVELHAVDGVALAAGERRVVRP